MSIFNRCSKCRTVQSVDNKICACGQDLSEKHFYFGGRHADGTQYLKSARTSSIREARRCEREYLESTATRYLHTKKVKFDDFADYYFYSEVNLKDRRDEESLKSILKHCKEFFYGSWLDELTTRNCNDFYKSLLKRGYAISSVNRYFAVLHRMLNFAIEINYLSENPVLEKNL